MANLSMNDYQGLSDAQIQALNQHSIEDSIPKSHLLIHEVEPVEVLAQEYECNPMFLRCVKWLSKVSSYTCLQRLKGDGNCFYRAFSYAFVNAVTNIHDKSRREAIYQHVESTLGLLKQMGVDQEIARDFFEPFQKLVRPETKLGPADIQTRFKLLMKEFNDPETSNSIVVFMRLIASAYLKVRMYIKY